MIFQGQRPFVDVVKEWVERIARQLRSLQVRLLSMEHAVPLLVAQLLVAAVHEHQVLDLVEVELLEAERQEIVWLDLFRAVGVHRSLF